MDYRTFKNELENYYSYKREKNRIENKISDLEYEMSGVKSIDYSKIHMNPNPNLSHARMLEFIEKKEILENELKRVNLNIQHIEEILSRLSDDDKKICLRLIAKKDNVYKICFDYGYSRSGIWAKTKRELEKILRD
jgi:hypothetical protein